MSLAIDIDRVSDVLLADGKWYAVADDSFLLDSYEYVHQEVLVHGGGKSGITSIGFSFVEQGGEHTPEGRLVISGPLTAIVAVKSRPA